MGQRHQLFVIAKVKARYRTLCAIHHQWLYGHTALTRCLGTLKIFQEPRNRLPIQQELIAAQRHDDSFWACSDSQNYWKERKNSHVPFPFIATSLVVGASYDPNGYIHPTIIEPFYMPYNGGDNNDGITIFDITNLPHVSYCFVDFKGINEHREVAPKTPPLMTPLSARTYLEAYYDLTDPSNSEDLLPLVKSLQGWDLIPASVLEDAWPGEGWKEAKTDFQEGAGEESDLKLEKHETAPRASFVTLRGQTMDMVIQNLLEPPEENSSLVAEAEGLTDFLPRLKDRLYDTAATMKWSSHRLDLLYQALQNEVEVDLSPLSNIPAKDLAVIVAKLYENGKMSVLNLSHRPDVSLEDLRSMIGSGTRLRVLYLLEMPQIPLEGLGQYLVNCEVHHSELLRWALRDYLFFKGRNSKERVPNTEFPATGVVSRIVWTGLSATASIDRRNYLPNGRIAWENLKPQPRKDNWFDIGGQDLEIRPYDLCVPITPCKLVPGVLRLLQWAGSVRFATMTELSKGMACSLASSMPCTDGTGHGISLLNPSLYTNYDWKMEFEWHSAKESRPFSLNPGEWALFLVSEAFDASDGSFLNGMLDLRRKNGEPESGSFAQASGVNPAAPKDQDIKFCPRKATSYALVTRVADSGPSQYMVADIPTYLKMVLGDTPEAQELVDTWISRISSIENAEFFGDDTYKVLPKVSYEDVKLEGKEAQISTHRAEHDVTGSIQVGVAIKKGVALAHETMARNK
ncbi:hypothetical protein JMJ35_009423 [Cladonia borealis]|uniref:Uncharacterized protein n=1 Tax=Cladonia borealis TaxID=184061 RepID=A0AA39QUV5_9LECA|nr:hypothetical protein JMJ35_009423 [Cladonia borealis]